MTIQEKYAEENRRDSILVEKYRNGDARAFDELAELHRMELVRLNNSVLHDPDAAEDAAQEELLILHKSLNTDKYVERGCFGGWLRKMARYFLNKEVRKEKSRNGVLVKMPYDVAEDVDDGKREEQLEQLLNEVNALPEKEKTLIEMRHWKGKGWKEVCNVIKVKEKSISSMHSKLLKKMKGNLGRKFENLTI